MRALYAFLLALLLCTGAAAQKSGHEYVPMLRDDLVWVGKCYWGPYHIQMDGDTIIEGITYKKFYRKLNNGGPYADFDMLRTLYIYLSDSTPVACMREADGKVYRMFERRDFYGWHFYVDDYDILSQSITYIEKDTISDEHYEAVIYDFDNPDIYSWSRYGRTYDIEDSVMINGSMCRVFKMYNLPNPSEEDDYIEEYLDAYLMVEGFGALKGGLQGHDMLCPGRGESKSLQPSRMGVHYVRDKKGIVLLYDDFWCADYYDKNNDSWEIIRDPYDFDGDRSFDIADVNRMINIMLKRQDDDPNKTADLTFDSAVDIEDLNLVINRLVSGVKPVKYSDLLKPKTE